MTVEIICCSSRIPSLEIIRNFLVMEPLQEEQEERVVGFHRRRTKGKIYDSPRIILKGSADLIGKSYNAYRTKAMYVHTVDDKETERKEGDCVILFFPIEKK